MAVRDYFRFATDPESPFQTYFAVEFWLMAVVGAVAVIWYLFA